MLRALVLYAVVFIGESQKTDVQWIDDLERDVLDNYSYNVSPYSHAKNSTSKQGEMRISLIYARLTTVDEQALEHSNILGLQMHLRNLPRSPLRPISANGVVEMQKYMDVTFACNFDTFRFPFDVQYCMYCLTLPFYTTEELVLNTTIDEDVFVQDTSEWALALTGLSSNSFHEEADFFYFNVTMTRRPAFWVTLVILPTFLLVTVVLLGLFCGSVHEPIENVRSMSAPHQVSLGLATMMSMTVNVGILNESLAKSQTLPIIGWFVLWEIVLITIAVISVLFIDQTKRRLLRTASAPPPSPGDGLIENRKGLSAKSINKHCSTAHFLLFIFFLMLHAASLAILLGQS
ncbi:hypothetical protein PRIPAC_90407 [Pristionchus pacificus]|uniref:Transmembrane ion channel n=1 Tax=Pristionchus pacificus TaxID=54126 RepID=A0A2A6B810_PRIPA|nr:hypothetical protein PRIPAC_90407 [Pristionchus pacificus]|eukprot:PDM62018.1 transmembrane ion channel [Pristionchus pacificus]